jgi:hypothetical protein
MSPRAQGFFLAAVLAGTGLGIAVLYRLRLAQGDVFPAYSSLRSDPLGTRALYESLARLPGLRVKRRFQALDRLAAGTPRTIVIAGMDSAQWGAISTKEFGALDGAVRGGSRLVLALRADFKGAASDSPKANAPKDRPEGDAVKGEDAEDARRLWPRGAETAPARKVAPNADLKQLWGVSLSKRIELGHDKGAMLAPDAPRELPGTLRWKSGLYFGVEAGAAWRVIYSDLDNPVLMEMPYGRGSVVVAGDAYFLSNEALQNDRATRLLAWLVGPNSRVEFDESHLGVVENVGVAALARRYGMEEAFVTVLLLALLFVWRRMALFVPVPQEQAETVFSSSQTAALEALLLRSVPPAELVAVCMAEWRRTARPSEIARLGGAHAPVRGVPAPEAYNAIVRGLRRK